MKTLIKTIRLSHVVSLLTISCSLFLSSCSGPDYCDCINNEAQVVIGIKMDEELAKECTEYDKTLTQKERQDRIQDAILRQCINGLN